MDGFSTATREREGKRVRKKRVVSGCKHRKAAKRVREERSGRAGTLAERLKMRRRMSYLENDGREVSQK